MAALDVLRFADTHVGQRLPATAATRFGEACDWPKLAECYVKDWAGQGALVARRVPVAAKVAAGDVTELIGMVYARHLDDSRNVEVEVTGKTRSGTKLIDLIRVRLN